MKDERLLTSQLNIRLPNEILKALDAKSKELEVTVSTLVRSVLAKSSILSVNASEFELAKAGKKGDVFLKSQRTSTIIEMHRDGQTLNEIGETLNLTRQRIQQILSKEGISARDGGAYVRKDKVAASKKMAHLERWGCFEEDMREVRSIARKMLEAGASWGQTPVGAFVYQKRNAITRGIEFKFKFWDWWRVWESSGKWDSRGQGSEKYMMCRIKEPGAYEPGNVYIGTAADNVHDWVARKYPDSRFATQRTP